MNYKSFFFSVLCAASSLGTIQAQGIEFFKGSWAEAKAKAAKENKHIFVDAYASWCGPCKQMAKDIFPQKEVGDFFNKHFVSVKLDVEKGEGVKFAQDYQVTAMPTLFYFAPDGSLAHKTMGSSDAATLISNGGDAIDKNKQLYGRINKFKQGEKSNEFLSDLFGDLLEVNETELAAEVFTAIWANMSDAEKQTRESFDLLWSAGLNAENQPFNYVVKNRSQYEKIAGKEDLEAYINSALEISMGAHAQSSSDVDFGKFHSLVKQHSPSKSAYFKAKLNYQYHQFKDPKSAETAKYQNEYYSKHSDNWGELNEAAWQMVGTGQTKTEFQNGLKWAERSVKLNSNPFNLDTKAWLLHKLGRNAEAKKTAQEAIKAAETMGMDMSATQELIDLIDKGGK